MTPEFAALIGFICGATAVTIGAAVARRTPAFAQEVEVDGQRVRLEAPTAGELARLVGAEQSGP